MFLFQLFLLINLSYILLLGMGLFLLVLVFPVTLSVLVHNWCFLLSVLLGGFLFVNYVFWSYRFFFYWLKFKDKLGAYACFLHQHTPLLNSKSLSLALQVYVMSGAENYVKELLDKQRGLPCQERFVLNALGYFLLTGNFQEACEWLNNIKTRPSFVLNCSKDLLCFLQKRELEDKLAFLKKVKANFTKSQGFFRPKGYFFFNLLYAYLYHLVCEQNSLTTGEVLSHASELDKARKDYLKFRSYPVYFMALSFFWSQAVSSLFKPNSIQ